MGKFPAFVTAMKLQAFYNQRKIFFGNDQIFIHKPKTTTGIFSISGLGAAQPFFHCHG